MMMTMMITVIILITIATSAVSELTLFKASLTENALQILAQVDQWWSLRCTSCNRKR